MNRSTSNLIGVIMPGPHPTCELWYFYPYGGRGCICMTLSSSVSILKAPLFFTSLPSHSLTYFRDLWLKRRVFASSTSFLGCEQKWYIFHCCQILCPTNPAGWPLNVLPSFVVWRRHCCHNQTELRVYVTVTVTWHSAYGTKSCLFTIGWQAYVYDIRSWTGPH